MSGGESDDEFMDRMFAEMEQVAQASGGSVEKLAPEIRPADPEDDFAPVEGGAGDEVIEIVEDDGPPRSVTRNDDLFEDDPSDDGEDWAFKD